MQKLFALAVALAFSTGSAQLECFYKDLPDGQQQQTCFDPKKPAEAEKLEQYKRSLVPRAGIFNGAAPVREMQTNRHLSLPSGVQVLTVQGFTPSLTVTGVSGGSTARFQMADIALIKGQENAALGLLANLFPPQSTAYIDPTGSYRNNSQEIYLWLRGSLVNIILIERGFALPINKNSRYLAEYTAAQAFATQNKLGAFAEAK